MPDTAVAAMGHNLPPAPPSPETIADLLRDENADLLKRREELLAAALRVPATIDDDETVGRVSDFIKQMTACAKAADSRRTGAKEPYLAGGRAIDGFFKAITDPLDKAKRDVEARVTVYLRRKAEEERQRRAEEERRAREAAEAARREAAERERVMAEEADLDAAIEANRRAAEAEADRIRAEQAAHAKAADLSRTRGDFGSVASLRTETVFEDLDRQALDLEALRPYLPVDGLEKAVRAFIKAGGRELRGVRIFERQVAAVR